MIEKKSLIIIKKRELKMYEEIPRGDWTSEEHLK